MYIWKYHNEIPLYNKYMLIKKCKKIDYFSKLNSFISMGCVCVCVSVCVCVCVCVAFLKFG
jgi:hypothetical protein